MLNPEIGIEPHELELLQRVFDSISIDERADRAESHLEDLARHIIYAFQRGICDEQALLAECSIALRPDRSESAA